MRLDDFNVFEYKNGQWQVVVFRTLSRSRTSLYLHINRENQGKKIEKSQSVTQTETKDEVFLMLAEMLIS